MFLRKIIWLPFTVIAATTGLALSPVRVVAQDKDSAPKPKLTSEEKAAKKTAEEKAALDAQKRAKMMAAPPDTAVEPTVGKKSFDLLPDQVARFQKSLPKAYAKLVKREPVHVVAVGDSVADVSQPVADERELMKNWPAVFTRQLAAQFYYTGDVRVIQPVAASKKKDKSKTAPAARSGPDITLRMLGRGDKTMMHAMQSLTTHGAEHKADLVLLSFGLDESVIGKSLGSYAKALQEVIEHVRASGAELVLVGPTMTIEEPAEASMGRTRAFADTMRDIAADSQVFFVDGGDLASLVKVPGDLLEPAEIFQETVNQYRRFFSAEVEQDLIHPGIELEQRIGVRAYRELIDGATASPWSFGAGVATLEAADKITLTYEVRGTGKESIELAVLPLITGAWKPMDAVPKITLKPGEAQTMRVSYALRADQSGGALPSHEPQLRLPILFSGGGVTRVEEVRAEIRPLTMLWKLDVLWNQDKPFTLENFLVNTSDAAQKGSWVSEWRGQKRAGEFSIEPKQSQALALTFDLPDAAAPWRQTSPLTLEVTSGALKLHFDRVIEVSRNIGLKQFVSLTPESAADTAPDNAAASPGVRLKADADANALYLTYEITGIDLDDAPQNRGAFLFELGLDARSFGKRLISGAVDALRLAGGAADGAYKMAEPQPWAFGTGYAARFDPANIRTQLSSVGSGARRLTITIPRTYLYLHEWALTNGNSQLGIGTRIAFWQDSHEPGVPGEYSADRAFTLTANGRHRDDAGGLAVLELTDKPTGRWTVNPF